MSCIYAYKGFDENLSCRGFQYEVGKTYSMEDKPKICEKGFHCCLRLTEVFTFYPPFDFSQLPPTQTNNRYCLIKVLGDFDFYTSNEAIWDGKLTTNHIQIIKELSKEEIIRILKDEAGVAHAYSCLSITLMDWMKEGVSDERY